MKRHLLLGCFVAAVAHLRLRSMQMPMPVRLNEEEQKNIDQAWDKALTPVDRLDHVAMLDAFLITHAYQVGVDKLTFHSEKKVAAGMVVMDIRVRPSQAGRRSVARSGSTIRRRSCCGRKPITARRSKARTRSFSSGTKR